MTGARGAAATSASAAAAAASAAAALYLASSTASVLAIQFLHYEGAADQRALLTVTANYVGMMLVACFPTPAAVAHAQDGGSTSAADVDADDAERSRAALAPPAPDQRVLAGISALDLLGLVCATLAIFFIGSGLFQVIYASIVIFNALLSWAFLQRRLTRLQWVAIVVVTLGLGLSVVGLNVGADDGDGRQTELGAVLAIVGTVVYASTYVLSERLMGASRVPPEATSFYIGAYCFAACAVYLLAFTLPNWEILVARSIDAHAGRVGWIIVAYAVLISCSAIHSYAYFIMLRLTGAVSTGLLQSVRAVLVFGASAYFFCANDEAQCFTPAKGLATAVVAVGVAGYVWASSRVGIVGPIGRGPVAGKAAAV